MEACSLSLSSLCRFVPCGLGAEAAAGTARFVVEDNGVGKVLGGVGRLDGAGGREPGRAGKLLVTDLSVDALTESSGSNVPPIFANVWLRDFAKLIF